MSQSRRWCFTEFAEQDGSLSRVDLCVQKLRSHSAFRGAAYQLEECPDTSRVHLQGYVEFEKPLRLAALKQLSSTAHWEVAKGSREHNVAYCSKPESCYDESSKYCDEVLKTTTTQGKRNDLLECAQKISSGEWDQENVHQERPDLILKFSKGVTELLRFRSQRDRKERRFITVNVIHGPAGSGKTRFSYGDGSDCYILENSNANAVWWDGYMGESRLIIDDFYGWITHNQLLRFLDIYPLRLDVKGGSTYAQWTTVFITSNKHPDEWYKKYPWEHDGALRRRIHHIWRAPINGPWVDEITGEQKQVEFN